MPLPTLLRVASMCGMRAKKDGADVPKEEFVEACSFLVLDGELVDWLVIGAPATAELVQSFRVDLTL